MPIPQTQARLAIFSWIETWYNPRRRHSGLGQMSSINFEKQQQEKKQAAAQNASAKATTARQKDGLPTGCFAPVDKTAHGLFENPSPCPQAGPVDNPAMVIINEEPENTEV